MNEKVRHLDLFSGIGGFALASDRVFGNVEHTFCEIDPFCQEILKKHWSTAKIYGDIRTLTNAEGKQAHSTKSTRLHSKSRIRNRDGIAPDSRSQKQRGLSAGRQDGQGVPETGQVHILTGGFPCQPFSQAGRRKGEADDRFLWPEMCRVIGEFRPTWVIAENVRGLLTQGGGVVFERVCTDLEALGYEVQPIVIPAVAVGAPHRRDRVWFVAHSKCDGLIADKKAGGIDAPISQESPRTHNAKHVTGADSLRRDDTNANTPNDFGRRGRSSPDGKGMEAHQQARKGARSESARRIENGWREHWLKVATRLCRVDDGLPRRLDRTPRLKALGNAIVPQVAEEIMRAIKYEHDNTR